MNINIGLIRAANNDGSYIVNINVMGKSQMFVARNFAEGKATITKFIEVLEEPKQEGKPNG